MSQSSEFYRCNPLCCFSISVYCCKHIFRYRLNPKTFRYPLAGDNSNVCTHGEEIHCLLLKYYQAQRYFNYHTVTVCRGFDNKAPYILNIGTECNSVGSSTFQLLIPRGGLPIFNDIELWPRKIPNVLTKRRSSTGGWSTSIQPVDSQFTEQHKVLANQQLMLVYHYSNLCRVCTDS